MKGVYIMYKLLIADDEYEIRNGLSHYVPWHDIGFEVVSEAANGMEVLEFLSEQQIDVILCDIQMPIKTGIDVARELFNQKSPVKVIFLSGYKEFDYAQQALNYGVKNYILKPTKYSELLKVFSKIKEELDQKRLLLASSPTPVIESSGQDEDEASMNIISMIKMYVKKHYKDATLEGASQLVHMNPFYISKYYKEKTGENFSDFVVRVKMTKAAELLKDQTYKVYEISEMIGYSNSKNFTRSFKKYFGISPREYRNKE